MKSKKLPKRLYQYQPCIEKAVANLLINHLYFAKPSSFNDPYDCRFDIAPASSKRLDVLRAKKKKDGVEKVPESDDQLIKWLHEETQKDVHEMGVCSLSGHCPDSNDSFLMWAHYAQQHDGFCLEFDTSEKPLSTARFIDYVDDHPSVDLVESEINESLTDEDIINTVRAKSTHWKYEDEWRIVTPESGFLKYQPYQLKAIYLGIRMRTSSKKALANAFINRPPAIYEMEQIAGTYKLKAIELKKFGAGI